MTIERRIEPTVGTYSAVILACARSGAKIYVNEAFRLAKEMLDAHRDARGRPTFKPDSKIFCALLEAAKRVGDLGRTRWILAEMVRHSDEEGVADVEVNEEVMTHVFHAYTAYHPPFKRTSTSLINEKEDSAAPVGGMSTPAANEPLPNSALQVEDTEPSFSHIPPQSRSEVVSEAKALFDRVVHETGVISDNPSITPRKLFKSVQMTPRLVNSYLSIHYAHSPLSVAYGLFKTLFADLDVLRSPVRTWKPWNGAPCHGEVTRGL